MSSIEKFIKNDYRSTNLDTLYDDYKNSKDKDFFKPTGTQVFIGRQGQGKTISMVKLLLDLKKRYPKCKVVSNVVLNVDWEYYFYSDIDELGRLLTEVNNGKYGVIYIVDEIHTYFNALDSKNIPSYIFTEISQQRKQRKLILGSSQLYLRMAKPFREQADTLLFCKCVFGVLNFLTVMDGQTVEEKDGKVIGTILKRGFFVQTRKLRNTFDTYQKVISGREQYNQEPSLSVSLKTDRRRR